MRSHHRAVSDRPWLRVLVHGTARVVMHLLEGNRQKVALIAALASDVELLLLDEPTAGRTVLLSSHVLAQVDVLADQWAITA